MRRGTQPRRRFRRAVAHTVVVAALVGALAPATGAENPSDLVADLADDGIYVADGRAGDVEAGAFLPVIERARADGVSMAVVWPDDPQPNTGAFARRVQEQTMLDVVLVYGPEGDFGAFVSEDYEDGAIRAAAAARAATTPVSQADEYLTGLLEEPIRETPAIVNDLVRWIVLLLAALVVGALGEQMIRQFKKSRKRKKLAELNDRAMQSESL